MVYDPRLGQGAWKNLRRLVLERDRWTCQIKGPKCIQAATCVDHKVARADGGDFYDLANLQAACRPCNAAGGAKLANRRHRARPAAPIPDPVPDIGPFRIF